MGDGWQLTASGDFNSNSIGNATITWNSHNTISWSVSATAGGGRPATVYGTAGISRLLTAYRQLGEIDKFVEACVFLITKSPTPAQQSITRRALLGLVFERGKLDDLANRYEDALKDPQDRTALYVLSELYSHAKPNPSRAAELIERQFCQLDRHRDRTAPCPSLPPPAAGWGREEGDNVAADLAHKTDSPSRHAGLGSHKQSQALEFVGAVG